MYACTLLNEYVHVAPRYSHNLLLAPRSRRGFNPTKTPFIGNSTNLWITALFSCTFEHALFNLNLDTIRAVHSFIIVAAKYLPGQPRCPLLKGIKPLPWFKMTMSKPVLYGSNVCGSGKYCSFAWTAAMQIPMTVSFGTWKPSKVVSCIVHRWTSVTGANFRKDSITQSFNKESSKYNSSMPSSVFSISVT